VRGKVSGLKTRGCDVSYQFDAVRVVVFAICVGCCVGECVDGT